MMKIIIPAVFILTLLLVSKTFSQINCNEEKINEIDDIKRTVENSLINSRELKIKINDSEVLASYLDGKLMRISVWFEPSEILYFKNDEIKCYVIYLTRDGKDCTDLYYFENNKVICAMEAATGTVRTITINEEAELLKKVERYLTAIQ